jgi:hypothetical protein
MVATTINPHQRVTYMNSHECDRPSPRTQEEPSTSKEEKAWCRHDFFATNARRTCTGGSRPRPPARDPTKRMGATLQQTSVCLERRRRVNPQRLLLQQAQRQHQAQHPKTVTLRRTCPTRVRFWLRHVSRGSVQSNRQNGMDCDSSARGDTGGSIENQAEDQRSRSTLRRASASALCDLLCKVPSTGARSCMNV